MTELLWLLLPVAAFSGWLVGRRGSGRQTDQGCAQINSDYFRGLNYLLNEQPDKAVEVFIRMVEVDSDTVETHLALGNLFRRRGEVDRAIRIHQNLIARPALSAVHRSQALLELAEDYMKAGVLDRAENLLRELLDLDVHVEKSLRNLLEIYQQEQEWEQAIEVCQKLQERSREPLGATIAQLHCELAEAALTEGEWALARASLKKALSVDRNCVRASILQGELHQRRGDWRRAIKAWERIAQQDVAFLPEVLGRLEEAHRRCDTLPAYTAFLRQMADRYCGVAPLLRLVRLEGEHGAETSERVRELLGRCPSVQAMKYLIEYELRDASGASREDLQSLHRLAERILEDKPAYVCGSCGFSGRSLHWQCPSCKSWNSIKPVPSVVTGFEA